MFATLSHEQQRFLLFDEIVGSTIVNFPLNAAIAWFAFRSAERVSLWGRSSIAADTLVTAFVLPLLTSLIATRIARARIAGGKLSRISSGWLVWLPRSSLHRGALL